MDLATHSSGVKATPATRSAFTLRPFNEPYSSCLRANGRKTFKWDLSAFVLGPVNVTVSASAERSQTCGTEVVIVPERGRTDVVTRSLLVLPEGVERTNAQSWLLCPKDVRLTFLTNVIQGSARCSVSVLGDIMGRALKNLNRLIQMPYGCGEQNMIVLAPNIYILQYLEVTGQLTAAIRQTATGYLQSGYQGQLNYRHSDGSYSTFGYDESNTWLTAFVLRSFGLATRFVFIDPNVLQSAKDWLISQKGSNGCFMQRGTLYHNDMKGGVDDNVTMTAYITASLLELGVPVTDPVITNALSCLRPVVGNLGNTYATALLTYTFSLAGETRTRSQLLTILKNLAISEGTKLHWSQATSGDTLAVEISSYVLLAVLSVQPLSTANLTHANRIVNWLVAQQNPYGGFSSTQVTTKHECIKLLSGFMADTSPLGSPPNSFAPLVERIDARDDHVLVYLKEVPKIVPMSYNLQLKQILAVKNLKPAVISVYDYYQPSDSFETTYTSTCP
ncbi:hypothetical protein G5714_003959 [Onychostoma macrolepis]|uniref:Alpha-macroglobulin receptor-binding domain-containing protein n=1 Tax=Onychostoma macrolepis TaxID=369639 RepID=A0A7J6DB48_9TELE|nr:hypothetical protein G5714_003959 [Onychostoma macrolepis]